MKTPNTTKTLATLLIFTFLSIGTSCQKKELSTTIEENQKVLHESSLYILSQTTKLNQLDSKNTVLLKSLKEGNKSAEAKLNNVAVQKKVLNASIEIAQFNFENNQYFNNPFDINPPCPKPRDCEKIKDIPGLLVLGHIKSISATVFDKANNKIGSLSSNSTWSNKKTGDRTYKFNIKSGYSGLITIKIIRISANNKKEIYNYNLILK
ncbi:MAG: hypothetical protein V3U92_09300 [Cellulophaga sp.]